MNKELRGVIRKIQDFLIYKNSFEISIMGINNIPLKSGRRMQIEVRRNNRKSSKCEVGSYR